MKTKKGTLPLIALLTAVLMTEHARSAGPWTLDRAIEHALTNSPSARIAQKRIAAARAGLVQANAAFWPQLQVQSSYTRTDNPLGVFGAALSQKSFSPALDFNDVPDADNLNARTLLTVPLYSGGRMNAARDAAKANAEASKAAAETVRHALAFEVARTFHTILKMRELIRAAESAAKSFESNLAVASNRVAAGAALKTEALDLQVRLAQAREDLLRARNANAISEHALRTILGIEEREFVLANSAPTTAVPEGNDFSVRPELAALRNHARAAEARVREARSAYRPRVGAFGSLDYDRGWQFDGNGQSYTAGLMLQWDLWDGKRTQGRVSEAQANLDAAREEERKLRRAIEFEIHQARLQFREATERQIVSESAVIHAQESVELTRARFEQGVMLAAQLIDAETALIAAQVRRAEAKADQRIAIAALRKALGLPQLDSRE